MKRSLYTLAILAAISVMLVCHVSAQEPGNQASQVLSFPDKLFKKIIDKTGSINNRLNKQAEKYLQRAAREERKLQKQLARKDSSAADSIFRDSKEKYATLQKRLSNGSGLPNKYVPHLDSLQAALGFLNKPDGLLNNLPQNKSSLKEALAKVDVLQERFNKAEEIKKYLNERKRFLQEQLSRFGLSDRLMKYKKQVYYYQAQVEEYRKNFEDPSKLESKALQAISRTSLFRSFFKKNSQLAALFNIPASASGNQTASLAGLQTRNAMEQELMQRFGTGPNLTQVLQQQLQGGQSELNRLKSKVNEIGGKNSDTEMPDFKPNNQKTKRLIDRLELGSNLQTVKSNAFFPSTSDLGLSLGYKLNDKSIAGIGSSYKMGWGKSMRQLKITHEGIGLRSFVDYKIKGSFWLSGGAEMNYRSRFSNFEILRDYSPWQKSALLGISKKYRVSNRFKGNMQLMYDFLWKEQIPRTQPAVFRVGYSLK